MERNGRVQPICFEKKEPEPVSDIIPRYLRAMGLADGMNEHLVLEAWDKVSGAAAYTLSKYVKDGVLYCAVSSSVVRNQLSFSAQAIVEAINREVTSSEFYSPKGNRLPLKTLKLR